MLKTFDDAKSTPYETIVLLKYVYIVFTQCTVYMYIMDKCTMYIVSNLCGQTSDNIHSYCRCHSYSINNSHTDLTNTTTYVQSTCLVQINNTHISLSAVPAYMYKYTFIFLSLLLWSSLSPLPSSLSLFSPLPPNHCHLLLSAPTIIIHLQWTFDSFHRSVPGLLQPPGPLPAVHSEGTLSPSQTEVVGTSTEHSLDL